MEISVTDNSIKSLLQEAKKQFISISIGNPTGGWSGEYFEIDEIKEFKHGHERITIVLLRSPSTSECTAFDARLIHGIKFDKYLLLNGNLYDEIRVVSKNTALQLAHQI
jgi:hypothetical protein